MANAAVAKKVDQLIADNNIVVFSKSWCPYCSKAKAALTKIKQKFEAIELDLIPDGAAIQAYLLAKTGQRTVPSIFINQKHIGGCDNLLSGLASGKITFKAEEKKAEKKDAKEEKEAEEKKEKSETPKATGTEEDKKTSAATGELKSKQ